MYFLGVYVVLHQKTFKFNFSFLTSRGADVNKEGPKDQTALHFAAANGNGPIAMVLLAHNANVRATDSKL